MKRIVVDTNILISALLFGGLPQSFLESAQDGKFIMLTSLDLLDELDETLARAKFKLPLDGIQAIRNKIEVYAEMISVNLRLQAVIADPDDDRVLECAVAGRADYIVTGDRHLLDLGSYKAIPIRTIRQVNDRLFPMS